MEDKMGNLLFSPTGRIGSQDFMKGGVVLIIVGIVLSLLNMQNIISPLLVTFAYLLMVFPWVCIWGKRMHNGGKSGFMIFLYLFLYAILVLVFTIVAMMMFGDGEIWNAAMAYSKQEITMDEYMSVVEGKAASDLSLPVLIGGVLASFFTLVIADKATPNDPDENQYGPA